jgi:hypothetical protein
MKKSGLADSPFFAAPQQKEGPAAPLPEQPRTEKKREKGKGNTEKPQAVKRTSNRHTVTPRHHDTVIPRYHDTIVEVVRKAVKQFGKEAATHRFTVEEKKAIADIIYSYRNQGIRTSENEIARIAVNFIVHDYRENGENSVLDEVLRALNG